MKTRIFEIERNIGNNLFKYKIIERMVSNPNCDPTNWGRPFSMIVETYTEAEQVRNYMNGKRKTIPKVMKERGW